MGGILQITGENGQTTKKMTKNNDKVKEEYIKTKTMEFFNFHMRNGLTKRRALRNTIGDLLKIFNITKKDETKE